MGGEGYLIGLGARMRAAALALTCMVASVSASKAEYLVSSGDTLEIVVYRFPELSRKAKVGPDGSISLLPLGRVQVLGSSLEEIRDRLRKELEQRDIVRNSEVAVELVETRPVYISGDVAKPGAYPYEEGVFIRQMIALAGGLEKLGGLRLDVGRSLSLQGERNAQLIELAGLYARMARIEADLNGFAEPDASQVNLVRISEEQRRALLHLEAQRLAASRSELAKEQAYLERVINQTQLRHAQLSEQKQQDEAGLKQQSDEVGRIQGLTERGVASSSRMAEALQAQTLARVRLSDTVSRIAEADRLLEEYTEQKRKLDESRRTTLLKELQDTNIEVEKLKVRIDAAAEQLKYARQRFAVLGAAEEPILKVYRRDKERVVTIDADLDTELKPGDVVEVSISLEQ